MLSTDRLDGARKEARRDSIGCFNSNRFIKQRVSRNFLAKKKGRLNGVDKREEDFLVDNPLLVDWRSTFATRGSNPL